MYLSLYLYSLNNKLKCVVNDVDKPLINFFNQMKKQPQIIIDGYNKLIDPKPTKEQHIKTIKKYKNYEGNDEENAIFYLYFNKFYFYIYDNSL